MKNKAADNNEATSAKQPRVRRAVQELTAFRQQLKAQQVARAKLQQRIEALSSELVGWRARIGRVRRQWQDMQALNAQLRADNAAMAAAIQQQRQQVTFPCGPASAGQPDFSHAPPLAPFPGLPGFPAAAAAQPGPAAMFRQPSMPMMYGSASPEPAGFGMAPYLSAPGAGMVPRSDSWECSSWEPQQEVCMHRSSSCGGPLLQGVPGAFSHPPSMAVMEPVTSPAAARMLPHSSSGTYLQLPAPGPAAATLSGSYSSAPAALASALEANPSAATPWGRPAAGVAAAATWVPLAAAAGQPSSESAELCCLAAWDIHCPMLPPGEPPVDAHVQGLVKRPSSNDSCGTVVAGGVGQNPGEVSPGDEPLDLLLADDTCWGSGSLEELMGLLADDKPSPVAANPLHLPLQAGGQAVHSTALEPLTCLPPSCPVEPTCSPVSGGSTTSSFVVPPPVFHCQVDSWDLPMPPLSGGMVLV